jgi:hypothetical protein
LAIIKSNYEKLDKLDKLEKLDKLDKLEKLEKLEKLKNWKIGKILDKILDNTGQYEPFWTIQTILDNTTHSGQYRTVILVEGNTRWGNTWLIPHIMMRSHHIVMRGISWVVDEMSIL